jgi:catechol 2,3-dioxygenase-like lactoylglutathione lyase family enzyme
MKGVTIELTHNYGTEKEEGPVYHPGNEDKDGFGHLAMACEDVYKCCEELEAAGVKFKKKPDEGRMKVHAQIHASAAVTRALSPLSSLLLGRRYAQEAFRAGDAVDDYNMGGRGLPLAASDVHFSTTHSPFCGIPPSSHHSRCMHTRPRATYGGRR